LTESRVGSPLCVAKRSKVRAYPLRTRLPNMQPDADRPHRGHTPGRNLTRELLGSLRLQRVTAETGECTWFGRRIRRCVGGATDDDEQLVGAD
jgi:hypothetical protein